ncbi:MAG: HAD family hydrolase [Candidatus Heimdallarchaeaceae archaeon]
MNKEKSMQPLREVNTLLFDMDGTLTDLWIRYRAPFFRAIFEVKPDFDEEKLISTFERILADFMKTTEGRSKILKLSIFLRARRELGISLIDTYRIIRILLADPMSFREIVPLEGVERVLETLHSRGYKLALVTSAGDKTVNKAKEKVKMLESFDVIVTRNTVKRIKPHVDALLYACKFLGKRPEECVMIGDFPQDVQAGKKAGTKTIAILGKNRKYTEKEIKKLEPDIIIETISELLDLFPQL